MAQNNSYCVFILSHGRPDRVYTFKALRKHGYTGPIYIATRCHCVNVRNTATLSTCQHCAQDHINTIPPRNRTIPYAAIMPTI